MNTPIDTGNVAGEKFGTYLVPGDPIALARARFGNRRVYDGQAQIKNHTRILLSHQHKKGSYFKGPLFLDITFYFEPPRSLSQNKKNGFYGDWHHVRPDLDNCIKFISDVAIEELYHDDACISKIAAEKRYDREARTVFTLKELR